MNQQVLKLHFKALIFSGALKLKVLKWKWKSIQVGPIKKIQFGGYALFLGLHCYATTASILEYEHFLMHSTSWFLAHSSTLGNMIYSTLFFGFLLYCCCQQWAFANITLLHKYWIHFASNVFSTFCNEWGALCLPISSLYIFHYHSLS